MTYTESQIERAKKAYNRFYRYVSLEDMLYYTQNRKSAQERMDMHNAEIAEIRKGNKAVERARKIWFCEQERLKDLKKAAKKSKKSIN